MHGGQFILTGRLTFMFPKTILMPKFRGYGMRSKDGESIALHANIELPLEATLAFLGGAQGIGLYRTEFVFLDRNELPSEEEQLRIYSDVVKVMAPRTVIFRIFDLGGDKIPAPSEGGDSQSVPPARICFNTRWLSIAPTPRSPTWRTLAILHCSASRYGGTSIQYAEYPFLHVRRYG
jgi:hypothetical protein